MITGLPTPDPCIRCGDIRPLELTPRDETMVYTAAVCVKVNAEGRATSMDSDVDRVPRGRLCASCTNNFRDWLKG